jgi:hypothetical protein
MFQALKSGNSIQHVGTGFTNAPDMQMMVGRIGINLGKEAAIFARFGKWIGNSGGQLSSFITGIGPIFKVVDIVLTWIIEHPKVGLSQIFG